jgi:hypothetical protein
MRGGTVFADILEEKIREEHLAASAASRPYRRPPTLGYFLFTSGSVPAANAERAGTAWRRPRPQAAAPHGWSQPASARAARPRPSRRLTAAQQSAFDTFLELGASVGPDFSAGELRSAFRELARRFHPDRHPGIAGEERARLTGLFVRAREAYRILRGL